MLAEERRGVTIADRLHAESGYIRRMQLRQVGLTIVLSTLVAAGSAAYGQSADTDTQGDLTARTLYYNSGDTDARQAARTPKRTRSTSTSSTATTSAASTSTVPPSSTASPLPD